MTNDTDLTREQWLRLVLEWTGQNVFGCGDAPSQPDTVRASVGWPSAGGLGKKKRVIGQCWAFECSEGKYSEIFISPYLSSAQEVVETLIHEVCHAAVGVEAKHKGAFVQAAKAVGFTKPWTSTPATEELKNKIGHFLEEVPAYPHAKLDAKLVGGPTKPQKNRHLKLVCPNCGYTIRSTAQWIEIGMPTCHCGGLFELKDKPSE